MTRRQRLDAELVRRRLAQSRQHAAELISGGHITIGGVPAQKSSTAVSTDAAILVRDDAARRYASRGAHKLLGALEAFEPQGLVISGVRSLDAGASTGGFTDVLLKRGAAHVLAVDVGYGQIDWRLRSDNRVHVLDRTNIRHITVNQIGGMVALVVADLSFISLTVVLPALASVCEPEGDMVLMIKPQFEVGKTRLGKGGVVRDRALHTEAIMAVCRTADGLGWGTRAIQASPLPGPSGNVEYFCWLRTNAEAPDEAGAQSAVNRGPLEPS